jgi:uncharacterized protein (TIGR02001 family)
MLVLLSLVVAAPLLAWDVSCDLSAQSKYVWRGLLLNDEPVFQPSLTLNHGGFSASVWFNVDLTDVNGRQLEHNEIDYWASYTFSGERLDLSVTAYTYTFPHTSFASTTELWASLEWKTFLDPTLTVVRDIDEIDGTYAMLTGSQSLGLLKVAGSQGLVLGLNVGYGDSAYTRGYYPDAEIDNVVDYGARLDWGMPAGPGVLKLNLQYSNFTSSDVKVPGFEDARSNLYGGITYSIPFAF